MRTPIAERLDIEFPIFAFTHCRDVVAAVCNTGAMGVLGAVGFTVEQLRQELDWLDEHVEGTYGVDIVIPGKYEGMDEIDPDKLEDMLKAMIPDEVREFARGIFDEAGVPGLTEEEKPHELLGFGLATAMPLLEEALAHEKCSLIANALGTPPPDVVAHVQESGRLLGALCGSVKHALAHEAAGLDFIVCQGGEGGGHTGDVGSIVLWPEVIEAVGDIPVLAAGGVGSGRQMAAAMVMGAQGVWTGSLWLTVEEADIPPGQMETYLSATQPRHHPVPLLDGQAMPDVAQRLDRRLGAARHPGSARHADAVDGHGRGDGARAPVPRPGQGGELHALRPDHRTAGQGATLQRRDPRAGRGVRRGDRARRPAAGDRVDTGAGHGVAVVREPAHEFVSIR